MRQIMIIFLLIAISLDNPIYAQIQSSVNNSATGEIFRRNVQPFLLRSENLFRQGNHLDALIELDNAVDLVPELPEVYLHRAMLKYRLGMRTEAQEDVAKAARLNPITPALFGINGPQAQMDLLAFYPEDIYQKVSWKDQLAHYEMILDSWYQELYSVNVTDDFPELESVIIHFESVLEALENKALYKAIDELAYLELFKGNTSVYYDLKGVIHLEMKELDKAAKAFRKAINLDPNNAMAWYNLSKVSQVFEEYESSLDFLNKSIGLSPNFSNAYFERAVVKKSLGDINGAIADYTQIIEEEENTLLAAYFNRAVCYKKIGKLTDALNDLDELLLYESDNPMTWKVRGNIHLLAGRYNQAIADFTKAIDLNSELGTAYFNRGVAHLLNHNPLTACNDFQRSANEGYERALDKQTHFCSN